jgi:hypothetical protein
MVCDMNKRNGDIDKIEGDIETAVDNLNDLLDYAQERGVWINMRCTEHHSASYKVPRAEVEFVGIVVGKQTA